MAQGKKGTGGETIKFQSARGVGLAAKQLAGPLSKGHGELLDATDVHRLAHLAGLVVLRSCASCSAGLPCAEHHRGALLHALSIKDKQEAVHGQEHQDLIDLYHQMYDAARGRKPAYSPADFRAFRQLREQIGTPAAKEVIEGAFRDPFWRSKATIQQIARDPSKFLGLARRSGGTLQHEEIGP